MTYPLVSADVFHPLLHHTWLVGVVEFLCKAVRIPYVLLSAPNPPNPYAELSDNELARYAKKDVDHFSELFDRYYTRVYQFHLFRIRQPQDAEDLTSDTFIKIFAKIDTFDERGLPFSAWVFTVARNTLIDFTRKNKIATDPIEDAPETGDLVKEFDMGKIERSVLTEKLWGAIGTLPEKQQQIWALKLSGDLPHKEIAEILGMSVNNVDVAISRSVKALKKQLSYLANDQ